MTADILSFFKDRSFDAEAARIMGLAFEKVRKALHDKGQPDVVQEIVARRILEIALAGERDPDKLAARALLAFGIQHE